MQRHSPLRTSAGAILFASATALVSTSASAICSISVGTPTSTVTPKSGHRFEYDYTLSATTGSCINFYGTTNYTVNGFELPYFADAGITSILSPAGWTAHIVDTDTFGLGSGAETLVWTAASGYGLQPDADFTHRTPTLSGFGYTAGFASAYAPAGIQLQAFTEIVDPALPASPLALQAGLQPAQFPPLSSVPEPSALLAMLAGLGCLAIVRRRRG